jgi:hypothetical protein
MRTTAKKFDYGLLITIFCGKFVRVGTLKKTKLETRQFKEVNHVSNMRKAFSKNQKGEILNYVN